MVSEYEHFADTSQKMTSVLQNFLCIVAFLPFSLSQKMALYLWLAVN